MLSRNSTHGEASVTANETDDNASNTELFTLLPNPPSHFSIESDLADELLKLSFRDRVAIQEEMHGVQCRATDETPELLEEALSKFDTLIMEKKLALEYELQQVKQQQQQLQLQSQPQQHSPQQQKPQTTAHTKKRKNLLRNVRHISVDQQKQQLDAANFANFASTPEPGKLPSTNTNKVNVNSHHTIHSNNNTLHNNNNNKYCYLNDPNVRLRFLRSERFDVPRAVQRFCGFLELTEELFGDYVADRPIRISDFNTRKEEVALQHSRNQYLPFRDRSGRRVFCCVGHCGVELGPTLLYKTMAFLHWVASEDIETQQKGMVIVIWPTDEEPTTTVDDKSSLFSWEKSIRPKLSTKIRRLHQQLTDSMPLRVTSRHAYYKDTPFFRTISALYYIGMNSHQKSVYKAHYGECGCIVLYCEVCL